MYIKITDGTPAIYPLANLSSDNPQTSFPRNITDELLATYNVYPFTRSDIPTFDPLVSELQDGDFSQDSNGNWLLSYRVVNYSTDLASSSVRQERNSLLQQTDYLALSDNTLDSDMRIYRQSLRDISTQAGFPYNVVWPSKPE